LTNDIDILIARFFDGTISATELEELTNWYSASADNKAAFDRSLLIFRVSHPAFDPASIDVDAAERKVLERIKEKKRFELTTMVSFFSKAAAILLLPVLALSIYLVIDNQRLGSIAQNTLQEVSALPGTRTHFTLPDGTEVWLNSGSTLTYPLQFEREQRTTKLVGEGYFKVLSDKKRPFVVETAHLNVLVTGTELNVESYPGDSVSLVTLINGKAAVLTDANKTINLKPNQCVTLDNSTQKYAVNKVDAALYGMWKDGILAFRYETLDHIMKRIGRTYNVDIRIKDPVLAKQKYRATFEEESLQQILKALSIAAPVKYLQYTDDSGGFRKEIIEVYRK